MPFAPYVTVEWAPASTPQDYAPTWVDISSKVMSLETSAGSSGLLDSFGAGTLRLEAWNTKPGVSAWADPNTWYKGRQIRVTAGGATLFHGWVRSLVHNVNKPFHTTVNLTAIDAVGLLSEAAGNGDFETWWGTSPENDTLYGRIIDGTRGYASDTAIDDLLEWIADLTGIGRTAPFDNGMMPMFIDAKQTGGLNALQDFLEAEGAYLSRDLGTPTSIGVQGRYYPFTLNAAAATATLTDTGGDYRYLRDTLELAAPDETYFDQATVGGTGVDPAKAANVTSGWFAVTWTRTRTPIVDKAYCKAVADHIVAVGSQTSTYPRRVSLNVAGPVATSVDASHPGVLIQIPGLSSVSFDLNGTTYKLRVMSIAHRIDEQGWRVTFGFASLDRLTAAYGAVGVVTLGTSVLAGAAILGP